MGGARPLQRVLEHVHDGVGLDAACGERGVEPLLVSVEDGPGARAPRLVPVVAVEEMLGQLAVLGDEARVRVGGVGEAHERLDPHVELQRGLGDELRVAVVAADQEEVRPRGLDLGELGGEVGRSQVVRDPLHQLVPDLRGERLDVIAPAATTHPPRHE